MRDRHAAPLHCVCVEREIIAGHFDAPASLEHQQMLNQQAGFQAVGVVVICIETCSFSAKNRRLLSL